MITIHADNTTYKYPQVSTIFDHDKFNVLVTYTADGEPGSPVYTKEGSTKRHVIVYLEQSEGAKIDNIKLWRLLWEDASC